jgi:hypothetical protein
MLAKVTLLNTNNSSDLGIIFITNPCISSELYVIYPVYNRFELNAYELVERNQYQSEESRYHLLVAKPQVRPITTYSKPPTQPMREFLKVVLLVRVTVNVDVRQWRQRKLCIALKAEKKFLSLMVIPICGMQAQRIGRISMVRDG